MKSSREVRGLTAGVAKPITQEALREVAEELRRMIEDGTIKTDSDIEDFAEEHGLTVGVAERITWEIISENTPCSGCKHVSFMATGMYPCNSCYRRAKDLYEPA